MLKINSQKITRFYVLIVFMINSCFLGVASDSISNTIDLADIWLNYNFYGKHVQQINWLNEGAHFTSLSKVKGTRSNVLIRRDLALDQVTDTLVPIIDDPFTNQIDSLVFDSYQFNKEETKLLLSTGREMLFRRSSIANYVLYDLKDQSAKILSANGKVSSPTFSPDGSKVAFVRANNLYVVDIASGEERRITNDGKTNFIINGLADWVYEEEFSFTKAFFWSPDSKQIAYYRFDESKVPMYEMQLWGNGLYPQNNSFKYPKAGEDNANVQVKTVNLETGKEDLVVEVNGKTDYVPRIKWTKSRHLLSFIKMNRHQNLLELYHYDLLSGKDRLVLKEESESYIDITDNLTYFDNGKHFLFTSEKDGYNHIYMYKLNGKLVRQLTKGNWEVKELLGLDEEKKKIYYSSNEGSPFNVLVYEVTIKTGVKRLVSASDGFNKIQFSNKFDYYIQNTSKFDEPNVYTLHSIDGKLIRTLQDNEELTNQLDSISLGANEFFSFTTGDQVELNGWMIKPPGFDESKKYPVLMYVYGGPGYQTVQNNWKSLYYAWFQLLAQKGYIVVSVDGRGTGGRGSAFKKSTYGKLGELETKDQIAAAEFLAQQTYVDAQRIGIFGWSFGGYLSSLCITKGAHIFKSAIAVAPVTNWRFYDTIYTERYLKTPQENAKGYDENSPVNFANLLKGNFLLVHGTGDDNVHVQNSFLLQNALIKAGKQFDSFYYPDKNHGIYGGNTRFHLFTLMTNFILEKL